MLSLPQLNAAPPSSRRPESGRSTHQFAFRFPIPSKSPPISLLRCVGRTNEEQLQQSEAVKEATEEDKDEEYRVLSSMRTMYNHIVIVDSPTSRMLLLDDTHNVHSVIRKGQKWTNSYWDEFASLPAVIPPGPIAILGLGGGTVANLMLDLWPSVHLEGWELDEILIDQAREYFGLSDLEKPNDYGGILRVHIGDALSPSTTIPGGYAGIIVDLFSEGEVLPELMEAKTWLQLSQRLMPNGRIMVNCGGSDDGLLDEIDDSYIPIARNWEENSALKAMSSAFGEQLSWKKLPRANGGNYFALTGTLPDLTSWSTSLPDRLSSSVKLWQSI